MMRIPKGYFTMGEAARRLGVHRVTMFRLVKGGRIRTVKKVRNRIVAAVDVDCLMNGIRGKS